MTMKIKIAKRRDKKIVRVVEEIRKVESKSIERGQIADKERVGVEEGKSVYTEK